MNGQEVFKFAVTTTQKTIEDAILAAGIKADDLAMIVPHQSNFRILDLIRTRLDIAADRVYVNIDRYGNTSAASVGLCLHELMEANETMDRVDVSEAVVHHLKARKETRWTGWQTRSDYPERDDANFDCFVETRRDPETGVVTAFTRPYEQLVPGDRQKA